MHLTNETFAPLRVMIDEFVRAGVKHAVVAPGSRNAPIAYALADREEIRCWSVLDERQAGFFALGIAKSTGQPVIVTCTSGSAAANLHPAVIEADHAGVPLIVLTADRPPELRDNGAGQAIDQLKLYGDSVRWFVEAGNHSLTDETLRHFRQTAARAHDAASGINPGPVHINLPLREPLRPVASDVSAVSNSLGAIGRQDGARWSEQRSSLAADETLADALTLAERPLLVVGEQNTPDLAAAVADLAGRAGAPVLADALSQMRRKQLSEAATIVTSYDLILRSEIARDRLAPDLVVRIGELPTSKSLRGWLTELDCRQIALDPRGRMLDPTRSATDHRQVDVAATVGAASAALGTSGASAWTSAWTGVELAVQQAIDHAVGAEGEPFEPAVYRTLLAGLDKATVWISSSMPIRDVESYGPITGDTVRFLANRGTNGIDGVVSSALGAKAPWNCDHVVLLTGDLAFLYDSTALAIAQRHSLELTIVCVDNGGGGIFSFLPLAVEEPVPEHFNELIATPQPTDIEQLVRAHGFEYTAPTDSESLKAAVAKPGFVHIRTARDTNKQGHDRVAAHVAESVAAALADGGAFH